jgi:hypothetical protein
MSENLLNDRHYVAFGSIIHSFARAETAMQLTLAGLTGTAPHVIALLTQQLQYSARRDTLYSWMEATGLNEKGKAEIEGFFDAVHKYSPLRNYIAHSIWRQGTRPGSIKPITAKVRGGKGKLLGRDDTEQDYTDDELRDIALRLAYIMNSYSRFLRESGLWDIIDEKMRASIDEISSEGGATAQ